MAINLNVDQLNELQEYLVGSTHTLDEGLEAIGVSWEQLSSTSFDAIDARMFLCQICGWWMLSEEDSGYNICHKCQEDADEDAQEEELIDYTEEEEEEDEA